MPPVAIEGGVKEEVSVRYQGEFRYLDIKGSDLSGVEKVTDFPETIQAPVEEGAEAGQVRYLLNGVEIGRVPVLFAESVGKAGFGDYLKQVVGYFLL